MTKRSAFKYLKLSSEIIRLAVMLYVRFPLSLRNVDDLLHERSLTSRSNFKLTFTAVLAEWCQLLARWL